MRVDYNILKRCIVRSCYQITRGLLPFKVDIEKLDASVKDLELVTIPNGLISRGPEAKDVPFISEYFKNKKLEWFNRSKQMTVLTFVPLDSIDDRLRFYLHKLSDPKSKEDPDFDPVAIMADIIGNYPVWDAMVVGYQSNDPDHIGKNTYSIVIRANSIVINSPDYQYRDQDI